jgi:thiol-disulfide isomerase/thioredoxin
MCFASPMTTKRKGKSRGGMTQGGSQDPLLLAISIIALGIIGLLVVMRTDIPWEIRPKSTPKHPPVPKVAQKIELPKVVTRSVTGSLLLPAPAPEISRESWQILLRKYLPAAEMARVDKANLLVFLNLPEPPGDAWNSPCDEVGVQCVFIGYQPDTHDSKRLQLPRLALDELLDPATPVVYIYTREGQQVWSATDPLLGQFSRLFDMIVHVGLTARPARSASSPITHSSRSHSIQSAGGTSVQSAFDTNVRLNIGSMRMSVYPLYSKGKSSLADIAPIKRARVEKKAVVLYFWATWCAPCRVEMPELARLQSATLNVTFIGLLDDSDNEQVRTTVQSMTHDAIPLQYFMGDNSLIKRAIFSRGEIPLPAFAIFDSGGHLKDHFYGSIVADAKLKDRLVKAIHD